MGIGEEGEFTATPKRLDGFSFGSINSFLVSAVDKLVPSLGGRGQGRKAGNGGEVQDLQDNLWGQDTERVYCG